MSTIERRRFRAVQCLLLAILIRGPAVGTAQEKAHQPGEDSMPGDTQTSLQIPAAMRTEHAELHARLEAATSVEGAVGEAARAVARVLDPHFAREEEIALPPLGLLEPLAAGRFTADMAAVLPLTDSLRAELREMLAEHRAIGAALNKLEAAAHVAGKPEYARLVDEIRLHARMEEQVNYPAAILVGELVRMKMNMAGHACCAR
jgi:hypothetical protein